MRGRIGRIMGGEDAGGVPSRNDIRLAPQWPRSLRTHGAANCATF